MKWNKQGLIFCTDNNFPWMKSHAQVPTIHPVENGSVWRVYFSTRDDKQRSHATYIDVEAGNPKNILFVNERPLLNLGKLGTFDDCGTMPSWVIEVDGLTYMYYIGWTVRNTIPYHNSVGLAVSKDQGKTFERYSEGPLFPSTVTEPYFTGTSCIMIENGIWKNWYLSCTKWEAEGGRVEPYYHIKYAHSKDGVNWVREGKVAIDYKDENEAGIVRASVLKENGLYRMWYSYRGKIDYRTNTKTSYKIGYAESKDGISWQRKDSEAGIGLSATGWDSVMLAYPHVVEHDGRKHMLYNGNEFSKTGIGHAILEE